jgi:hypothetical protein
MYIITFNASIEKAVGKVITVAPPEESPAGVNAFFRTGGPNRHARLSA